MPGNGHYVVQIEISIPISLSLSSPFICIYYIHTYTHIQLYIQYEQTISKPKCPERREADQLAVHPGTASAGGCDLSQDLPHRRPRSRLGPCDDSSTEDQSAGPASNLRCDPTTRRASLAFTGPFSPKSLGKCQVYQNQREGPGSGSGKRQMAVHEPPVGTCRYILISPKHCQHLNINIFQKCRFQLFLLKIRFIITPK